MASYLVTGASRGLGYAFIKQFASNPENTVFGLVRNRDATLAKLNEDGLSNVTILEADIENLESLKTAATEVSRICPDGLDYLIANAAYNPQDGGIYNLEDYSLDPSSYEKELLSGFRTNVIGLINTVTAFKALVSLGRVKKIIAISSGMADTELVNDFELDTSAPYSISKAGLNMVVAKYNALYKREGILCMAICPGMIDTATEEDKKMIASLGPNQTRKLQEFFGKFNKYAPGSAPVTADESAAEVMTVVNASSLAVGSGGKFVSHIGTKRWL